MTSRHSRDILWDLRRECPITNRSFRWNMASTFLALAGEGLTDFSMLVNRSMHGEMTKIHERKSFGLHELGDDEESLAQDSEFFKGLSSWGREIALRLLRRDGLPVPDLHAMHANAEGAQYTRRPKHMKTTNIALWSFCALGPGATSKFQPLPPHIDERFWGRCDWRLWLHSPACPI